VEPNLATVLPGIVFAILAAVFMLVIRHQNLQRYRIRLEMIQKERLIAMEKGLPLPEAADYDEPRRAEPRFSNLLVNPRWPLGVGAILICGGIGTTIALYLSQEPFHNRVWSMGLIPVFVGLGLFLHYRLTRVHER
jgi:hypothetical protein